MTAYQNITGSGYLNNPVRTVIIDRDNRPGSYPTHVSPIDLRRPETADLIRPFRDDLTVATPRAYATARVVFGDVLPTPGSTLTLTGLSNPVGPATVSSVFEFQPLDVSATTPGARVVSLAGVLTTAPDPGLPGLTPKQLTRRRAAERLIEAVNATTGSLISARPGSAIGEVLLEQRVPGSAGNLSNSTTAPYLTVASFSGGGDGSVRYPYGVQVVDGDPSLVTNELVRRVVRGVRSGTLDVPTSGRASLLDAPSDGHPYVAHSPFDETGAQVAFGINTGGSTLYGTQAGLDDPFITRGSTSGSLDEPLGAKDKIEIDLTPVEETILFSSGGYPNFPMAYFNFNTRRWDPIGFGNSILGPGAPPTTLQDLLETQYLGFSQGITNIAINTNPSSLSIVDDQLRSQYTGDKKVFAETGWFTPIDTFGFPLHPKYHATGSQTIEAESLVDRPFLLEKIVYEFSASAPNIPILGGAQLGGSQYIGGGGAFFILNQRKANPDPGQEASYTNVYVARTESPDRNYSVPQEGGANGPGGDHWALPYENGGIPRTMQLSPSGPDVYVDTVRDLVTFARVGTVWPTYEEEIDSLIEPGFPHPATYMDLAIEVPKFGTFSGEYTLAAPIKAPTQNSSLANIGIGTNVTSPANIRYLHASKDSSTRNAIDLSTGRAYRNEFLGPEISYLINGHYVPSPGKKSYAPKADAVNTPYLIAPGDRLVFGWQAPISFTLDILNAIPSESEPIVSLKLLPGKGKLTLYGSYLQDNKPVHDIFKDQLNSDAAHETIPSGPWVLDRFESEPQMMYSSSMREEHVTGTMVTRNADGTLSVTDPGDLSIGGVRAVSARASDGNLGQRWSFFRNNRLFDSEEQYYDSMLPNPLKYLLGDSTTTFATPVDVGHPQFSYPLIGYPNETTYYGAPSVIDPYVNRKFIGSFPFEKLYGGIERVKKIDNKIYEQTVRSYNPSTSTYVDKKLSSPLFITGSTTPGTFSTAVYAKGGLIKSGIPLFGASPAAAGSFFSAYSYGLFTPLTFTDFDTNPVTPPSPPALGFAYTDSRTDQLDIFGLGKVNYHFSRLLGCFGDGIYKSIQFLIIGVNVTSGGGFVVGLDYRGTKHGLINPTPLFSSAVFNGTQFGQFRDLMEQRQYTRFSLTDSSLTDAAVEVVFIDRSVTPDINGSVTNNIVTGSATNSSNVSPFATSEHPYDDALADSGLIWDRDTPLPEEALAF